MASVLDHRMEEIAGQREADRTGLDRIAASTATVNAGMSDPVNWVLFCAGIVLIPVTGALSIALIIWGLLRMTGGGRAYAQAIPPTAADLAAPGPGCVRMLAALGSLILLLIIIALFGAIVAYHLGVKP